MPTLNWIGKDKVINHHMDVPYRVLEHSYSYELGVMNDKLKNTPASSLITHHLRFNFYELWQPLFLEDGNLNELVGIEKNRQYIYYTETKMSSSESGFFGAKDKQDFSSIQKSNYPQNHNSDRFLGKHNDTAYYFHYNANGITTLNHEFLASLKTKAEQYVIYADNCLLTKDFMTKHNIIFKKISRDITRF